MKHDFEKVRGVLHCACRRCGSVLTATNRDFDCPGWSPPPEKIMVGRFEYIRLDTLEDDELHDADMSLP